MKGGWSGSSPVGCAFVQERPFQNGFLHLRKRENSARSGGAAVKQARRCSSRSKIGPVGEKGRILSGHIPFRGTYVIFMRQQVCGGFGSGLQRRGACCPSFNGPRDCPQDTGMVMRPQRLVRAGRDLVELDNLMGPGVKWKAGIHRKKAPSFCGKALTP
jgi:hypothetical protein